MKHFGKIIIVFNNFCKKFHLNSLRGSEMCRILNMDVLDMDVFLIFRDSEYTKFLQIQALRKVLHVVK